MKKVKIGTAGVDSGQLMITDPCYIRHFSNEFELEDIRRYKHKKTKRFYSMERTFLTMKKLFLHTIKP